MRANVNILTAASEAGVGLGITGYENSVAAHVTGDWGKHNQFLFHATPFAEFVTGHTLANGYLLRLLLTGINLDGTGDAVFTVPAIVAGTAAAGGGPLIIRQPASQTAAVGAAITFTVKAISAVAVSYQWRKNGSAITGAVADTFLLPSLVAADQGSYDVVVTNVFGFLVSATATLTVT